MDSGAATRPAGAAAPVAAAFDCEAAGYDEGFGRNPVGLLFRYTVQERLLQLFRPGARVLDLGCGTGEDALLLAAAGLRVHGLDVSGGMIERAREKARTRGIPPERVDFEVRPMEQLAGVEATFDGAYSAFGALNCADLGVVGRGLAHVLRSGAPLLLCLMGPRPLPAMLERGLTARGEPRRRSRPRVGGIALSVEYPAPAEVRRRLGPEFTWRRQSALGVLVPGPPHAAWVARHPQSFGLLAALERVVRDWPLLRSLGDHLVFEGVRR